MIEFDTQILLINFTAIAVIITNLIFGSAILFKNIPREVKISAVLIPLTIVFFIFFFTLSFNVKSQDISYLLFSFSSVVFMLGVLFVQIITSSFRIFGTFLKRFFLGLSFLLSVAFMITGFIFPEFFIGIPETGSVSSGQFFAGEYFFVVLIFWLVILLLVLFLLIKVFWKALKEENYNLRNKVIYVLFSFLIFYGFGLTLIPLLYNAHSNILFFLLSGFITVPLNYGTVTRSVSEPLSILKRVMIFILVSLSTALFVGGVFSLNDWISVAVSDFPQWVVPIFSSFFAVALLMYFWYTYTDTEILKYEFISIVTHKFRTPLTRIKWSVQILENAVDEEEKTTAAEEIARSAQTLVDLTDILVDASKMENHEYQYKFSVRNLNSIVERVYEETKERIEAKEINYNYSYDDGFSKIYADDKRLQFALQILFENAVSYTPKGGSVSVKIIKERDDIIFSITDTGIGISAKEQNFLFSKFYRSRRAKLADPNGMGIGVFMAKRIVERHEAKIWATSPGPNSGSTFWISFPNAAH